MLTYNNLKTLSKDFRNFYKRQTKKEKHNRLPDTVNNDIIRLLLKKVAERLVNTPSGVLLQNIGYFHVYMIPYQRVSRYNGKIEPRYKLTFVPTDNSYFKFWSMDYAFTKQLEDALRDKIKEGYIYYNVADSVSNINPYTIGKSKKINKQ